MMCGEATTNNCMNDDQPNWNNMRGWPFIVLNVIILCLFAGVIAIAVYAARGDTPRIGERGYITPLPVRVPTPTSIEQLLNPMLASVVVPQPKPLAFITPSGSPGTFSVELAEGTIYGPEGTNCVRVVDRAAYLEARDENGGWIRVLPDTAVYGTNICGYDFRSNSAVLFRSGR